jgi:hypothetical protein
MPRMSCRRYRPSELLRWLVGDVLAGIQHQCLKVAETPPDNVRDWLFEHGAEYWLCGFQSP